MYQVFNIIHQVYLMVPTSGDFKKTVWPFEEKRSSG